MKVLIRKHFIVLSLFYDLFAKGVTFGILVDIYDLSNTLFSFCFNDGDTF